MLLRLKSKLPVQMILQNGDTIVHPRFLLPLTATPSQKYLKLVRWESRYLQHLFASAINLGDVVMGETVSQIFGSKKCWRGTAEYYFELFFKCTKQLFHP